MFESKRRKGQFIGAFAPYGYAKSPIDKNRLIVDEQAATVVKGIFEMYINGTSICGIVRELNRNNTATPTQYKSTVGRYKNTPAPANGGWRQETIRGILSNQMYIGNMVQNKSTKINYKIEKTKRLPRDMWIIVNGTHEPIVDNYTFQTAQNLLLRHIAYDYPKHTAHLLGGLLFCGECKSRITFRRNSSKRFHTLCSAYSRFGECSRHGFFESELDELVIGSLRANIRKAIGSGFYDSYSQLKLIPKPDITGRRLIEIDKRLAEILNITKSLYEDKVKGVLSEELFISMSGEYKSEQQTLLSSKNKLLHEGAQKDVDKDAPSLKTMIKSAVELEVPDKTLLTLLIERIELFEDRQVKIYYTFDNI